MMIVKNKTMMSMMLIILTIDHSRQGTGRCQRAFTTKSLILDDVSNLNQHRCENKHFEQDNVNDGNVNDNYDPHEQDKLMFTGFYVEKLHNLIRTTFHIIELC